MEIERVAVSCVMLACTFRPGSLSQVLNIQINWMEIRVNVLVSATTCLLNPTMVGDLNPAMEKD